MQVKTKLPVTDRGEIGIEQRKCMTMAHDSIMESLRTALYPWLARPIIIPVSFHIDFLDAGPAEALAVEFALCNGALHSKLVNLNRNGVVLLHYSFTISDNGHKIARGLFKIRIRKNDRT